MMAEIALICCPCCQAPLKEDEIRSIYAKYASSKRSTRKGWPKGMPRPKRPAKP